MGSVGTNVGIGAVVGFNKALGGTDTVTGCYRLDTSAEHGIGNDEYGGTVIVKDEAYMKSAAFVTDLNTGLSGLADLTLYTWKETEGEYPAFDVLWLYPSWDSYGKAAVAPRDYEWNSSETLMTIKTAQGLAFLASQVNSAVSFANKTIALACDINLNVEYVKNYNGDFSAINDENSWSPIGTSDNPFLGTFDGRGHKIIGIKINKTDQYHGVFLGLFGDTDTKSVIKNVGVTDFKMQCSGTSVVIGGITGLNYGVITNCYTGGEISGNGVSLAFLGGITGYQKGEIKNCYSTCVIESNSESAYIGGIVGRQWFYSEPQPIVNCYYLDTVAKGIGDAATESGSTVSKTAQQLKSAEFVAELNSNLPSINNGTVFTWKAVSGDYPVFDKPYGEFTDWSAAGATATAGTDYEWNSENTVMTIKSAKGLAYFANQVNGGNSFSGKTVKLGGNIKLEGGIVADYDSCSDFLSSANSWKAIGNSDARPFSGTFNGGGYTIEGIKANDSIAAYQGMFGYASDGAVLKNTTVNKIDIISSGAVAGIGGVVAFNCATVANCKSNGSISYVGGEEPSVGGVTGYNSGTVINCSNTANVSDSTANPYVGGITGGSSGKVINCNNSGSIYGEGSAWGKVGGIVGENLGTVTNCFNTGKIYGKARLAMFGGIVGRNMGTAVTNVYNTGSVSGEGTANALIGAVLGQSSGQESGCYYFEASAEKGMGDETGVATVLSDTEMKADAFVDRMNEGVYSQSDSLLRFWLKGVSYPIYAPALLLSQTDVTVTDTAGECVLTLSSYKDGKLLGVKLIPVTQDTIVEFAENGFSAVGADEIKAMLRENGSSMRPICRAAFVIANN